MSTPGAKLQTLRTAWALKWRSENQLTGKTESLRIYDWRETKHCGLMLFRTRAQARAYRDEIYGYIRNGADLKAEPHGWKMPAVIKVTYEVKEI